MENISKVSMRQAKELLGKYENSLTYVLYSVTLEDIEKIISNTQLVDRQALKRRHIVHTQSNGIKFSDGSWLHFTGLTSYYIGDYLVLVSKSEENENVRDVAMVYVLHGILK